MATRDRSRNTRTSLPASGRNMTNWTAEDVRRSDILVLRQDNTDYVESVVAPNGLQIGLLDEAFLTDLLVTGHITGSGIIYAESAFSGSLQTLVDGSDYLRAGSNVTITNNSDGSITIASSGGGGSGSSRTKSVVSITGTVSAGTAVAVSGHALDSFNSTTLDVFLNGDLLLQGTQTQVNNGTHDFYTVSDVGSNGQLKFRYDVSSNDELIVITGGSGGGGGGGTTYTAGNALSLSSSQFNVDYDNTTIGVNSSDQLEVKKTPGTLSVGNGLQGGPFNGSGNASISVKPVSGSPITVTGAGVGMSITSVGALTLGASDEVLVSQGGTIGKTTVQAILNLSSGGSGAPADAAYLVATSNGTLSAERVLTAGNGIGITDGGANSTMTVTALLSSGGGLKYATGQLAVKVADFIDFGLSETSGKIKVNTSALAGAGLTANGNVLDVNFGSGSTQSAKGSNTISIGAGDGLNLGGTATIGDASSSINLAVASSDIKGSGLSVSNNNLDLYIQGANGITISSGSADSYGIPIVIDGSSVSGNVDYTGTDNVVTDATDGTGITVDANNDKILLYDHDTTTVKYVNVSQLPASATGDITGVTAGVGLSGGGTSGAVTLNVDINGLASSLASPAHGDLIAAADADDSNAVKKITIGNLTAFQTGWSNSSGYGIQSFNGRLYLKPSDLGTAAAVDPAADTLVMDDADDSSTVAKKTTISSFISAVKGAGLAASNGVLSVDYVGTDSIIKSATDGTGITVDSNNDFILIHDTDDSNTVKYIKPSQLTGGSGTIGAAEDGDYTDGLFTTFTSNTTTGTAIDKINEVLKLLAPSPAPDVKSINTTTSNGINAKLSFGSSNTGGSTYANSGTAAGFSAVNTNGTYSASTSGNNERLGIFLTNTNIEGIVNHDVSIAQYANSTVNHVADAFGNGELGNLKLEVNGTVVHTVDLSSFTGSGLPGSGATSNSLTSDSGFYQLSTKKDATSEGGTTFNIFKHRTTKYRIHHTEQRQGWNYARVVHTVGSTNHATNYIEWINDTDTTSITASGTSVSNISGSDEFVLSGIKYFKTCSFDYATTINNAHRALHTATPIVFNSQYGSITSATDQNSVNLLTTFPGVASGQDFTKSITVSAAGTFNVASSGFPAGGLLNAANTLSVNVVHPNTSKNQSGLASTSVPNLLMWFPTAAPTALFEDFNSETWRQQVGAYATQAAVYTSGAFVTPWNSATKVNSSDAGHNTGLVQYQGQLKAPRNTLLNGNFASITNGPGSNANYSGITTGTRTYYRAFKKTSAGSVRDIRITLNGSGTLVTNGTTLGANNKFKCFVKVPGTTGWMDLAGAFVLGSTADNDGAYVTTLTTNINGAVNNYASFGLNTIAQNDHIMIKIEADAAWTGYLNSITVKFGASTGDETSVPDSCSSINSTTGNGVNAKLSFGASQSIPASDGNHPYTNVSGTNSLSNVDINNAYTASGLVKGIYDGTAILTGVVNSGEAGDAGNFAANAIRYGNEGTIKLFVNDVEKHFVNLASYAGTGNPGSGTALNVNGNGSGFSNVSTAQYVTWSDGIPDYRYSVRTMHYRVVAADQRSGHNWVRVVHTVGSTNYTTNYVEWVNDPNNNGVTFSNVDLANFTDTDISSLSGIKYFNSPSTTFKYRVNNMHKNVYSQSSTALGFIGLTNVAISNLEISGAGVQDPADVNAIRTAVPPLLTNSDTNYTLPMDVTGSFNYTPTKTLPGTHGTSANDVTINAKAYHPIKNTGGASQSASKSNFLVWTPAQSGSSNQQSVEDFTGESYRLQDSTYATTTDITNKTWSSTESVVGNGSGSNAGHNTGLVIYNEILLPPSQAGSSGNFASGLQGPSGNVDYSLSNVSNNTRTYLRAFYNPNAGDSASNIVLSMTGTASLKSDGGPSNSGTLGNNTNIHIKVKLVYHSAESAKTTGWLDAGEQATGGNADGAGCSGEALSDLNVVWNNNTQTVQINHPTGRGLYGTSSPFNRNYVIIKIEAHKQWTGKFTAMSITSYN